MAKESLAEKFIEYTNLAQRAGIKITFNGFYEWAKVPEEQRNNDTAIQLKKDLIEIQRFTINFESRVKRMIQ